MSDKFLPNISVGDFAMDILNDMAKNPSQSLKPALKESTLQAANAPDVSRIQVSDDYVSLVLEGKKPQSKKVEPITESSENKLTNLVERLSSLISEARQIMEEISCGTTGVGNIGTNTLGRSKKPKKGTVPKDIKEEDENNPWAICQSKLGSKKTDKLERCIMKLKKKYGTK